MYIVMLCRPNKKAEYIEKLKSSSQKQYLTAQAVTYDRGKIRKVGQEKTTE